jgi:hypothetical protein
MRDTACVCRHSNNKAVKCCTPKFELPWLGHYCLEKPHVVALDRTFLDLSALYTRHAYSSFL